MAFLVLLITLAGYKLLGLRVSRDFDQWFFLLADRIAAIFKQQTLITTLLTLLLPIGIAGMILTYLQDALFGLMGIALHVLLLFYSFGRDNLLRCTEEYLTRWRSGDVQSAYHFAAEHFKVEDGFEASNLQSLQRKVCAGILYQWFEQIFVVLFWYLLAGPLVALFIRIICLYDQWLKRSNADTAMPLQLLHVIEWLPARILGFTFTIAGNFALCFKSWVEAVSSWHMPTERVLNNAGMAALGVCSIDEWDSDIDCEGAEIGSFESVAEEYAREIGLIQDLVVRSLIVWLVVVAIAAIT